MFSGIAYCADCGQKLYYCTTKYFESRQDHFVCSTSRKGKDECSTHFIRAVVLEQGVLAHMNYVISYITLFEESFREVMGARRKVELKKELAAKRKIISKSERRIKELDRMIKSIYEDKVNGILSENRFQIFSEDYEQEPKELDQKIATLTAEIEQKEEESDDLLKRYINTLICKN